MFGGFCLVAVGRLERWKDFRGGVGEAAGPVGIDRKRGRTGAGARFKSPASTDNLFSPRIKEL